MREKRYWILESRGSTRKWTPKYVYESAESAAQSLSRLRQFDQLWSTKKERRVLPVVGVYK